MVNPAPWTPPLLKPPSEVQLVPESTVWPEVAKFQVTVVPAVTVRVLGEKMFWAV